MAIYSFPPLPCRDDGAHLNGLMSVRAFLRWAGIGKSKFYKEVRNERLFPQKVGTRTLIAREEAERWKSNLPNLGRGTLRSIPGEE